MKLVTFDLATGARHIGALLPGDSRIVDFTAGTSCRTNIQGSR